MKRLRVMAWILSMSLVLACAGCSEQVVSMQEMPEPIDEAGLLPEADSEPTEEKNPTAEQPSVTAPAPVPDNWYMGVRKREEAGSRGEYQSCFYLAPTIYHSWEEDYIQFTDCPNAEAMEVINQDIRDTYKRLQNTPIASQGSEIMKRMYPFCEMTTYAYTEGAFNNAVSVRFQSAERRGKDADFSEEQWDHRAEFRTYDLNTGKVMQLRDFFYEDTDYVSLLNRMVADAEVESSVLGELPPFEGITPDQPFYLEGGGGITIVLDYEKHRYLSLDGETFAEISAMGDIPIDTGSMGERDGLFLYWPAEEIALMETEVRPSYCGIPGLDETVTYLYLSKMPKAVSETIRNLPACQETFHLREDAAKVLDILGDDFKELRRDITVTKLGPIYSVKVYLHFETAEDWYPAAEDREFFWKHSYALYNEQYLITDEGELQEVEQLFREDISVNDLLAEKFIEYWQNQDEDSWEKQYLDAYEEDSLGEAISGMDMEIASDWLILEGDDRFFYLPWQYLYDYIK